MYLYVKLVDDDGDKYISVFREQSGGLLYSVHCGKKADLNVIFGDQPASEISWAEVGQLEEIITNFVWYYQNLSQMDEEASKDRDNWKKLYYEADARCTTWMKKHQESVFEIEKLTKAIEFEREQVVHARQKIAEKNREISKLQTKVNQLEFYQK